MGRVWQPSRIASLVIAFGVALRLRQYLSGRSLWLDESLLALNIASRSYHQLLRPLDYLQTAPIPYLWIEHLAVQIGGVNEFALRAFPLIAGIVGLVLVWDISRQLFTPASALFALTLAAISPLLIRYGEEAKPYIVDATLVLVMIRLTLAAVQSPGDPRTWWRLAAGGAVTALCSTPAPLILGSVGTTLLALPDTRRKPEILRRVVGLGLLWMLLYLVVYLAFYRQASQNPTMQRLWANSFYIPSSPAAVREVLGSARQSIWAVLVREELPDRGLWLSLIRLVLVLWAVGVVALVRRLGGWAGLLVAGPLVFSFLMALLRVYPVAPRLLVYLSMIVVLLLAGGIDAIGRYVPRPFGLPLAAAVALPFLIGAGRTTMAQVRRPIRLEDLRPVVKEVMARRQMGEPVYVYTYAVPAWTMYTTNWTAPDTARLAWIARQWTPPGPAFSDSPSRGATVREEGADLVYASAGGPDLLGLPTGMEYRSDGPVNAEPDAGWADNEVARLQALARPCGWFVFSHAIAFVREQLVGQARRAGGRRTDHVVEWGASAQRFCFLTPKPDLAEGSSGS